MQHNPSVRSSPDTPGACPVRQSLPHNCQAPDESALNSPQAIKPSTARGMNTHVVSLDRVKEATAPRLDSALSPCRAVVRTHRPRVISAENRCHPTALSTVGLPPPAQATGSDS